MKLNNMKIYSVLFFYILPYFILSLELNNLKHRSILLTIKQDNEYNISNISCNNGNTMSFIGRMYLSTKGRYKCNFPIKLLDESNKRLYTVKPKMGVVCDTTSMMIIDSDKKSNIDYPLKNLIFEGSCRNTAVVDFKNCINESSKDDISTHRTLFQRLKEPFTKGKVIVKTSIFLATLFTTLLFSFVFASLKYNKRRIIIKILKDKGNQNINIKCSKSISTKECSRSENENTMTRVSEMFWDSKPSTNEGMLDGFIHIHEIDIDNTQFFIKTLKKQISMGEDELFEYGIDAGCGIGRVTPVLIRHCKRMDLNEPVLRHLNVAVKNNPGCSKAIHSNLQDFTPPCDSRYDFIWIQWATQYLSDEEFIDLLIRIKNSFLTGDPKNSSNRKVVCIKDNTSHEDEVDQSDFSIIRTEDSFYKIFKKAGYKCILTMEQTFLPSSFKLIKTFAITPY
ncbi:hypothetical protein FG379_002009 [Cryptosporidium bovis]|uniref:uncharacterized protein n=1 Tax=Cryptosporidium bovis TaxID=310047 RepID=UPI00351A6854|nr:hypothetical protein FG379_002009 [Cryptosporidium bovis]